GRERGPARGCGGGGGPGRSRRLGPSADSIALRAARSDQRTRYGTHFPMNTPPTLAACLAALALTSCKEAAQPTPSTAPVKVATPVKAEEASPMRVTLSPGGTLGPKPVTYKAALPAGLRDALKKTGPA